METNNKSDVYKYVQPDYLPFVTEKDYLIEGYQKRVFGFHSQEYLHKEDNPRRHLGVLGLIFYKPRRQPVQWLTVNIAPVPGEKGNLYELPITGHVEFRDFLAVYGQDMPEEPYMNKAVWAEAFTRQFHEKTRNVDVVDHYRLYKNANYSLSAFYNDIPLKKCGNNLESSAFITYELTEEEARKITAGKLPIRWVSFTQLYYEHKYYPACFANSIRRVLHYIGKKNEVDIEQLLRGSVKECYYFEDTSFDTKKYVIHTGGPYQSPAGPSTDESDYYEIAEERYDFYGTLDQAREKAREIVKRETKDAPLYEYCIKSLVYWITDELGTPYV